ncbi:hypothetical protein SNEBB_002624 [Seison nebaliae]|nr:hypothetical protein SNEBB_002624 [Seison nebaliae]
MDMVLRKIFNEFDRDRTITKNEAKMAIRRYMHMKRGFSNEIKIKLMTEALFKLGDRDRDGRITYNEFAKVFKLL